MATMQECRSALEQLAEKLSGIDPALRRRHALDRTVSCRLPDLESTFVGRLHDGTLHDITVVDGARKERGAQIRLTVSSDDLVALTNGQLGFASAWAKGRLRIDASMLDLLRLRTLL